MPRFRDVECALARLAGMTYVEIGLQFDIGTERARQLAMRGFEIGARAGSIDPITYQALPELREALGPADRRYGKPHPKLGPKAPRVPGPLEMITTRMREDPDFAAFVNRRLDAWSRAAQRPPSNAANVDIRGKPWGEP